MAFCDNVNILQTINIHTSDVTCCDFANNFTLITGSSDKTVRLWEWVPGVGYKQKDFSPLLGHKYGVTCVKVSPQGSMLATASIDGSAILWNLHSGAKIYTMVQVGGNAIRVCRFAPDSSILVTAGDNGALCIWDLIHRSLIKTIFQHEGTTQALAFTPDSQYLVSACSLEVIRIWSTQSLIDTTNDNQCSSVAHIDNAQDLGILSADISNKIIVDEDDPLTKNYTLATSGNNEQIKVWKITAKAMPKHDNSLSKVIIDYSESYIGHKSAVTCIKYNQSATFLVSASLDKTVRIWDIYGGCIATLTGHTRYLNTVTVSKDSSIVVSGSTGSNDKSVIVWDLLGNLTKDSELIKCHTQLGNLFLNNTGIQEIHVVRSAESDDTCKLIEKIDDISDAAINSCCFNGDSLLVTGSSDKLVRLFKLQQDNCNLEELNSSPIDGHSYIVNHVKFSNDGSMLATCSLDGCAYIWNPLTGEKLSTISENYLSIRVVSFSPDNKYLLVAGDDEIATVWECQTLNKSFIYEGHTDSITSASFSPDGKIIATACNNGDFRLWREGANIHVQDDAHDLGIQGCDFSENLDPIPSQLLDDNQNYLLGTCGNDSLVKLWWIAVPKKGNELVFKRVNVKLWRLLRGHGGNVISVKFSPKTGEIACSTGTDRQARIWSVYSGDCIHVLDHDSITTCCAFNRSCSILAVGCLDKTLWLWKLPLRLVFQNVLANKFKCRNKTVADWGTSDVVQWLNDVGLSDIAGIVTNTTLDGHKLWTLSEDKICSGLDLDEQNSEKLTKEIRWLKSDHLQQHIGINNKEEVPFDFLCPITHEIMLEPVTCSDGFTYERKAITEWFMAGKFTSPMTNETLRDTDYKINTELRNRIHTYLYSGDEP